MRTSAWMTANVLFAFALGVSALAPFKVVAQQQLQGHVESPGYPGSQSEPVIVPTPRQPPIADYPTYHATSMAEYQWILNAPIEVQSIMMPYWTEMNNQCEPESNFYYNQPACWQAVSNNDLHLVTWYYPNPPMTDEAKQQLKPFLLQAEQAAKGNPELEALVGQISKACLSGSTTTSACTAAINDYNAQAPKLAEQMTDQAKQQLEPFFLQAERAATTNPALQPLVNQINTDCLSGSATKSACTAAINGYNTQAPKLVEQMADQAKQRLTPFILRAESESEGNQAFQSLADAMKSQCLSSSATASACGAAVDAYNAAVRQAKQAPMMDADKERLRPFILSAESESAGDQAFQPLADAMKSQCLSDSATASACGAAVDAYNAAVRQAKQAPMTDADKERIRPFILKAESESSVDQTFGPLADAMNSQCLSGSATASACNRAIQAYNTAIDQAGVAPMSDAAKEHIRPFVLQAETESGDDQTFRPLADAMQSQCLSGSATASACNAAVNAYNAAIDRAKKAAELSLPDKQTLLIGEISYDAMPPIADQERARTFAAQMHNETLTNSTLSSETSGALAELSSAAAKACTESGADCKRTTATLLVGTAVALGATEAPRTITGDVDFPQAYPILRLAALCVQGVRHAFIDDPTGETRDKFTTEATDTWEKYREEEIANGQSLSLEERNGFSGRYAAARALANQDVLPSLSALIIGNVFRVYSLYGQIKGLADMPDAASDEYPEAVRHRCEQATRYVNTIRAALHVIRFPENFAN